MQPRRPVPPEPSNPFEAAAPDKAVKIEPRCHTLPVEPPLPQVRPANVETGTQPEPITQSEPITQPEPIIEPPPVIDHDAVLKEVQARLAEAEARATEQHDAWLRAKAETENVRRRAQEEIIKASKFAAEKFAVAMLPVKDSLETALATRSQTLEALHEGVELTLKQLIAAFEGANLIEENPIKQKFDPNKHQAVGMLESDAEPNTVINVLQKGYLLHGRVIRPAMVMVAKAKPRTET